MVEQVLVEQDETDATYLHFNLQISLYLVLPVRLPELPLPPQFAALHQLGIS